jgi:hypothetical protein
MMIKYILCGYNNDTLLSCTSSGIYSTYNNVQQHRFHRRRRHRFSLICSILITILVYVSVLLSSDTSLTRWFIHAFQGISYSPTVASVRRNLASYEQQLYQRHGIFYNIIPSLSSSLSSDHDRDDISSLPSTTVSSESFVPSQQNDATNINHKIKFLGKGKDAIVRLGCVLISPQNEFHHFYRQAAIFIYAMGYDSTMTSPTKPTTTNDNNTDDTNNETYYIRGVIIDHPTPFTVPEMIPILQQQQPSEEGGEESSSSLFHNNLIFRGGDKGHENSVLMLHNQKHLLGCSPEIGTSGLYHGGLESVIDASTSTSTSSFRQPNSIISSTNRNSSVVDYDSNNFKFFFNYCEFTEDEIEELFLSNEDNDSWCSVEVTDPYLLLNNDWDRGDCWRYIRNTIRQHI